MSVYGENIWYDVKGSFKVAGGNVDKAIEAAAKAGFVIPAGGYEDGQPLDVDDTNLAALVKGEGDARTLLVSTFDVDGYEDPDFSGDEKLLAAIAPFADGSSVIQWDTDGTGEDTDECDLAWGGVEPATWRYEVEGGKLVKREGEVLFSRDRTEDYSDAETQVIGE